MDIDNLKEQEAKKVLQKLIDKLDILDYEDFFGTEGWRHFFDMEDEI